VRGQQCNTAVLDRRSLESGFSGTHRVARPARIYDLRSTFASNALAASVTVFELARVMGTSVRMIEKHYGTLLEGAHAGIATRLAALEAELEQGAEAQAGDV
jgi:hypothetical protein